MLLGCRTFIDAMRRHDKACEDLLQGRPIPASPCFECGGHHWDCRCRRCSDGYQQRPRPESWRDMRRRHLRRRTQGVRIRLQSGQLPLFCLVEYWLATSQPLRGLNGGMQVRSINGLVTRNWVQIEALKATSSHTASSTLGTQAKQMTKKVGPSAGSAKE